MRKISIAEPVAAGQQLRRPHSQPWAGCGVEVPPARHKGCPGAPGCQAVELEPWNPAVRWLRAPGGPSSAPGLPFPLLRQETNACQPSVPRDLINECLSSGLSRDPFNERYQKQRKTSWQ